MHSETQLTAVLAQRCAVPLGRRLGVHSVHRRDVLQLDWCGPYRAAARSPVRLCACGMICPDRATRRAGPDGQAGRRVLGTGCLGGVFARCASGASVGQVEHDGLEWRTVWRLGCVSGKARRGQAQETHRQRPGRCHATKLIEMSGPSSSNRAGSANAGPDNNGPTDSNFY